MINIKKIIPVLLLSTTCTAGYSFKVFLDNNLFSNNTHEEINGDIYINPQIINRGEMASFSWHYSSIDSLTIEGDNLNYKTSNPNGNLEVNPLVTTQYKAYIENNSKIQEKDFTLKVIQPDPVISFTSDKYQITQGESSILSWDISNAESATLDNGIGDINPVSSIEVSPLVDTTYTLNAIGYNREKILTRNITIVVNEANKPTISMIQSPTPVFNNTDINLSWSGTDVEKYTITGSHMNSGVPTTETDIGDATSYIVRPTSGGTFTYTIKAINSVGASVTSSKVVIVEDDPSFSNFTVNSSTSIIVSPSTPLTFRTSGQSSGSVFVGRNEENTQDIDLPDISRASAGIFSYYGAVKKTINGVTRYSPMRTAVVSVHGDPLISNIVYPQTNVFTNATFATNWTGESISNYYMRGSHADSGVPVTDQNQALNAFRSIKISNPGTYTYTVTGANYKGITTSESFSVTAEADPTFTGLTVNGGTNITVPVGTPLTFLPIGNTAGSNLVGRNAANNSGSTLPSNAALSVGTTTYYGAVQKNLNGVIRRSAVISVTVTTVPK